MTESSTASLPLPLALPLPNGWDTGLLEPVAEINERLLECLQRRALGLRLLGPAAEEPAAEEPADEEPAAAQHRWPPLLRALPAEWCALGATGCSLQQLAACPYLLLDASLYSRRDATASAEYFPGPEGVALLRRALVFAWHVARCNRVVARVVLGVGGRTLERMAAWRLQELDALAEGAHAWAVPRWPAQPAIWRALLLAARRGVPGQLRQLQLRGLQLMAAQPS